MLTDEEVKDIERQRQQGVRGPILLTWLDRLLADRRERVRQLAYFQQRLRQAFRYLDGLLNERGTPGRAPVPAGQSPGSRTPCPLCGKPYARASGISPSGIRYVHGDGRECRTSDRGPAV